MDGSYKTSERNDRIVFARTFPPSSNQTPLIAKAEFKTISHEVSVLTLIIGTEGSYATYDFQWSALSGHRMPTKDEMNLYFKEGELFSTTHFVRNSYQELFDSAKLDSVLEERNTVTDNRFGMDKCGHYPLGKEGLWPDDWVMKLLERRYSS